MTQEEKKQENKGYDFKEAEERMIKKWDKDNIFKFDEKSEKPIFAIDTPPPTVSGKMHIGHAFSFSQMDFIARYKRMRGYRLFYPFGTDDNGLPTERLVEKSKNVRARDMSREEFIKLCKEFLKQELPKFIQDWKNIGISCDFDIYYSTINEHSRKISQWSFLDLYEKGRIYRKDAPSMWCPECQTGVAQVECQDKKFKTNFNRIVFKVDGKNVEIDTTRPELLPACVAVFYNPDDKRHKKLKGKQAKVPLFNFSVPIMEDKRVDIEKGTGIVMCCTFGDQTDMEWQKAYNLEIKQALTNDGKMSGISEKYSGMKIKEARKTILEDLKSAGLLLKQEPIEHDVKVHERCGTEIEFIKSRQWFVKYLDLKEKMLQWGEKLNWHPKHMKYRYDNWVNGLQWDWLISNQRYFGVPFPVWYCEKCGEVMLAEEKDLPVNPLTDKPKKKCKCGSGSFIGEKDILNTWFTSSMTPQLASGLMNEKTQKQVFPMSLRPQAHDIITFWLFNTVLKSNLHFGKNPWKDIIISGFVTLGGEKMSKSKGNIIEPREVLEKYGADALRYWGASSNLGEDIDYQEKEVVTGKKFVTKIFNAANFVFMNLKDYKLKESKNIKLEEADRLFLIQLNKTIKSATEAFEDYGYSKAKNLAAGFFWKDFCDNYLEIVKNRIYNGTKEEKESAEFTLYTSLLAIIKMMAPITPFITEEIYQEHFKKNEKKESLHLTSWPETAKVKENKNDEEVWNTFIENLSKVRQEKSKAQKSVKAEIILTIPKKEQEVLKSLIDDLKAVITAKEIKTGEFSVEFI
jgi:valyl-tRNA synthetase